MLSELEPTQVAELDLGLNPLGAGLQAVRPFVAQPTQAVMGNAYNALHVHTAVAGICTMLCGG